MEHRGRVIWRKGFGCGGLEKLEMAQLLYIRQENAGFGAQTFPSTLFVTFLFSDPYRGASTPLVPILGACTRWLRYSLVS
jgi:hypothetical protein